MTVGSAGFEDDGARWPADRTLGTPTCQLRRDWNGRYHRSFAERRRANRGHSRPGRCYTEATGKNSLCTKAGFTTTLLPDRRLLVNATAKPLAWRLSAPRSGVGLNELLDDRRVTARHEKNAFWIV